MDHAQFQKMSRRNSRTYDCEQIIIGILLFLALLLGGLVTLIGHVLVQEVSSTLSFPSDEELQTMSVYCHDLSLSPDEDFDTFGQKKNSLKVSVDHDQKYICSSSDVAALLQKIVERQSRIQQSKGLDSSRYLSCGNASLQRKSGDQTVFLSGISSHQVFTDQMKDVKLHWNIHTNSSQVHPLVHYHHGEIDIPEGRTYYVYASIHFNIADKDNIEKAHRFNITDNDNIEKSHRFNITDKDKIEKEHRFNITDKGNIEKAHRINRFTLRLCRKISEYEQTLLVTTKVFRKNSDDIQSSLRLEGALQLERNDKIYVKVSKASKLILKSTGNTFGIFPL